MCCWVKRHHQLYKIIVTKQCFYGKCESPATSKRTQDFTWSVRCCIAFIPWWPSSDVKYGRSDRSDRYVVAQFLTQGHRFTSQKTEMQQTAWWNHQVTIVIASLIWMSNTLYKNGKWNIWRKVTVYKLFPALSFITLSYKTEHLTFIGMFLQITSRSRTSLSTYLAASQLRIFTDQMFRTYRAACLGRVTTVYLSPLSTVLHILLAEVRHCTMPHGYDVGLQLGFTVAIYSLRL